MIVSFKDRDTERLFDNESVPRFEAFERVARRKLLMLAAAHEISDLRRPPGNRLERLKGDREGDRSIRINDRYRLCFRWREGNAHDVEITDYHR